MSYSSLLQDVYDLTKRPDLVAETAIGVKTATLQLHSSDFYSKDLYETGISFTTSDYLQTLDYKLLLPRWRQIKYLRKYDAVGLTAGKKLDPIVIEKVLDGYKIERTDVFYLAGSVYQIKCSTQEQYFLLGAYLFPDVNPTTFTSWIADEYPYAVAFKAASIALKMVGLMDVADTFERQSIIFANEIASANITTVGE